MADIDVKYYADDGTGVLLDPLPMVVYQRASTNLFLNSDAPATQNITVVSGTDYVVWVDGGTGDVVLSGAATGTVTEAGGFVTFSAATTTLTLTYTATLDHVQVEAGVIPTGKITTDGSTVATDETINTYPSANWSNSEGPIYIEFENKGVDQDILLNDGVAILYLTSNVLYLDDGTNTDSIICPKGVHRAGFAFNPTDLTMHLNLDATWAGEGLIVAYSDGVDHYLPKRILDSDENSFTVGTTVTNSDGNNFTVI